MKCKYCNAEIEQDARFCPNCGKDLSKFDKCVKCGELLNQDAAFCPHCGTEQPHKEVGEESSSKKWIWILCTVLGIVLIVGGIFFFSSNKGNFLNVNGAGEVNTDSVQMVEAENAKSSEVVGTLTAYYATEDFKTDQGIEYKKGQLICDSNDPINRIVEQGDDNYKYEGDDTGEYYSWLLPKSKVEKRVYKMNKLEVKDVGKGIKFVSDEGFVARIFWSKINGHGYYNWNGHEHKWEEQQKLKECYVLSVEYRNGYWEEQLDEKQGCINLYSDNDTYYSGEDKNYCRYREGPIGYIEERWYNKEGWDNSKSAYSEDGNLLVDQWEIDGIADHTSIAYIAEKNALYVDGELYYKKK